MKSDHLFELVKSLTRTEKSNFKKDALAFGGKNAKYLLLFEALEKQKVYDKERLLAHMKDEKLSRNLSMAKSYLYEAILKSLHIHRKTYGYNSALETSVNQAQVLFRKGLFHASNEVILKAKILGYKLGSFQRIIQLIGIQQKMYRRFPFDKSFSSMHSLIAEKREIVKIMVNDLEFEGFSCNMLELVIGELDGKGGSDADIEKCYTEFVVKKQNSPISNLARMQYLEALRNYYNLTKNSHQSLETLKELRKLLESDVHFAKRNDSQNLIFVYHSIGYRSIELEDFELTLDCLKMLEEQKPEYKALEDYRDKDYLELSMLYVIATKDFSFFEQLKLKFSKAFDLGLNNFLQKDGYGICYRLAHIHFLKKAYEESLDYVSLLMQEEFMDKAKGLASDVRILFCLNHLALDNDYLVSKNLKTAKRSLSSSGDDLLHKELVLELLVAYSKNPTRKRSLLKEFKQRAEVLQVEVGKPYHFVNLITWLS